MRCGGVLYLNVRMRDGFLDQSEAGIELANESSEQVLPRRQQQRVQYRTFPK
jgi:hypothetical protein